MGDSCGRPLQHAEECRPDQPPDVADCSSTEPDADTLRQLMDAFQYDDGRCELVFDQHGAIRCKCGGRYADVTTDLPLKYEPGFFRAEGVIQRSALWHALRDGLYYTRMGSSSSGSCCGFGVGMPAQFVQWRTDHPREKTEPNMFMIRGTMYEPLVLHLYEFMSKNTTYDGGYWIPKCKYDREKYGDSPDFILFQDKIKTSASMMYNMRDEAPEHPEVEDIIGVGELKYVLSYEMFDESRQKMEHVTQPYLHMSATGAPFNDYLAVMGSEHAKDGGSHDEPFIKHLLFSRVHRDDWFMEWMYARLAAASMCQSWNRSHPAAQIMVQWERESSSTFSHLNIEYFFREENRSSLPVGEYKYSPAYLNSVHAARGWNKREFPDGRPWGRDLDVLKERCK